MHYVDRVSICINIYSRAIADERVSLESYICILQIKGKGAGKENKKNTSITMITRSENVNC